jgi:hypothetical protein
MIKTKSGPPYRGRSIESDDAVIAYACHPQFCIDDRSFSLVPIDRRVGELPEVTMALTVRFTPPHERFAVV